MEIKGSLSDLYLGGNSSMPALNLSPHTVWQAVFRYLFMISGSDSPLVYSSWVLDLSRNQIHTFHAFQPTSYSSPIFLSLNITNGTPTSLLYNFNVTCSYIYHIEMKDTYLYATGFWNPLLTIFVFDTTTSTFSLYSYQDTNIRPYYLVLDPNSDR